MDGTQDALINLATAATVDIDKMMLQCKTIYDLNKTIAVLTRQFQQAATGYNSGSRLRVDRHSQANSKWVNGKHVKDMGGYCWTHGHCVNISHDSRTCCIKREGHRNNATRDDNMGENLYGKTR